jgi:hypothetical protein
MPGDNDQTVEEGVRIEDFWLKSTRFMRRVPAPMAACVSRRNFVIKGITADDIVWLA